MWLLLLLLLLLLQGRDDAWTGGWDGMDGRTGREVQQATPGRWAHLCRAGLTSRLRVYSGSQWAAGWGKWEVGTREGPNNVASAHGCGFARGSSRQHNSNLHWMSACWPIILEMDMCFFFLFFFFSFVGSFRKCCPVGQGKEPQRFTQSGAIRRADLC